MPAPAISAGRRPPAPATKCQYTTNLASAGWTALGDTAAADTGERSMTDSVAAGPARFYRVLATTAENPIQNLSLREPMDSKEG